MNQPYQILVSDVLSRVGLTPLLNAPNMTVDIQTDLTSHELLKIIPNYDALLIRSATQVTEDVIQAAHRLCVIRRAGVGIDNIDLAAATQAGIVVVNAPTGNVVVAAEHTIAMLYQLYKFRAQFTTGKSGDSYRHR